MQKSKLFVEYFKKTTLHLIIFRIYNKGVRPYDRTPLLKRKFN